MEIEKILNDKGLKAKEKAGAISKAILDEALGIDDVIKAAQKLRDAEKGTCMESLELATRLKPGIATPKSWAFAVKCLEDEAPRVKWEAAKVIANTAPLFKTKLDKAVSGLLANTEHPGTVVRWSAAQALGKIVALKTKHNAQLVPAIEAILKREDNNAIRKIYTTGLKKAEKK